MNWKNLWIETDSVLVVLAFKNMNLHVAWSLRNIWHNAIVLLRQMNFIVSHIFREENQVADCSANYGLSLSSIMFWHEMSLFIKDTFDKNKLGQL
jgi:isoprenylcysteine carboxyl methyltransferase (ICMT) family protein YpbQ